MTMTFRLKKVSKTEQTRAGVEAIQHDQARRNVEEAIKDKDTLALAQKLATFNLEQIREEIANGIKLNVNGKIDKLSSEINDHNKIHEDDMKRVLPVIEAYEEGQRDLNTAKKAGRGVLWVSAAVTGIGGAYLVLLQIFRSQVL
jgi:hypothetical protein